MRSEKETRKGKGEEWKYGKRWNGKFRKVSEGALERE